MTKKLKVAAAQLSPVFLNKEKTVDKACKAIIEAGKNGANLIVFPEAFISGYPDWVWLIPNSKGADLNELYLKLVENAVSVPDDSTKRLCEAAKTAGINVVMGMHERNTETSSASLFNSLLFIDDKGLVLGKHRKLIPTGGERLIWSQGDGSTLTSYDTSAGRIAGLICWENYMPLARMSMYLKGVEIYIAPTADSREQWTATMQQIALEGRGFVLGCNQYMTTSMYPEQYKNEIIGQPENFCPGGSVIISRLGKIIQGPLFDKAGVLTAELDLEDIKRSKLDFDVIGHYARNDIFDFKVKGQPDINKE